MPLSKWRCARVAMLCMRRFAYKVDGAVQIREAAGALHSRGALDGAPKGSAPVCLKCGAFLAGVLHSSIFRARFSAPSDGPPAGARSMTYPLWRPCWTDHSCGRMGTVPASASTGGAGGRGVDSLGLDGGHPPRRDVRNGFPSLARRHGEGCELPPRAERKGLDVNGKGPREVICFISDHRRGRVNESQLIPNSQCEGACSVRRGHDEGAPPLGQPQRLSLRGLGQIWSS